VRAIERAAESDAHYRSVHTYNAWVTQEKVVTKTRRAQTLYGILSLTRPEPSRDRLLIVGPRNVQELLIAWLYGSSWELMVGIDLYSTTRRSAW
jgi:hypothetical protein